MFRHTLFYWALLYHTSLVLHILQTKVKTFHQQQGCNLLYCNTLLQWSETKPTISLRLCWYLLFISISSQTYYHDYIDSFWPSSYLTCITAIPNLYFSIYRVFPPSINLPLPLTPSKFFSNFVGNIGLLTQLLWLPASNLHSNLCSILLASTIKTIKFKYTQQNCTKSVLQELLLSSWKENYMA